MHTRIGVLFCFLFSGVAVIAVAFAQTELPGGLSLFTNEEALQLRMSDREWDDSRQNLFFSRECRAAEAPAPGPFIVVQDPRPDTRACPPAINCASPLSLRILFETNLAPVDMDSLEVTARKGFFSTSLTDRLRPYIQGAGIAAENIDIPSGRYCITVSIADAAGARTVHIYGLNVK